MFSSLTCMFSFQTCLQSHESGGKKCVQLLNTLFTVYFFEKSVDNFEIKQKTCSF